MIKQLAPMAFVLLAVACSDIAAPAPADGGAPVPLDPTAGMVPIEVPAFELAPGAEAVMCSYVPPSGLERWASGAYVNVPGSHHMAVRRIRDARGVVASGPVDCANGDVLAPFGGEGNDFASVGDLFSAGVPELAVTLPDGVAVRVAADEGLLFEVHAVNAATEPRTVHVGYWLATIDAGEVIEEAGSVLAFNQGMTVPPGLSTQTAACEAPSTFRIFTVQSHMHSRGRGFSLHADAREVVSGDASPYYLLPNGGASVAAGEALAWSCDFDNDTGEPLTVGPSVAGNEMCGFVARVYPFTGAHFCQGDP